MNCPVEKTVETPAATDSEDDDTNVGLILGLTLGGAAILLVIMGIVCFKQGKESAYKELKGTNVVAAPSDAGWGAKPETVGASS